MEFFFARLQVERIEGAIIKIIENFAAKQLLLLVSNSTQPADLSKYLEAQGLKYLSEFPGMAIIWRTYRVDRVPKDINHCS